MNEQNDFERLVADQLANVGVGMPPGSAIEETIARAGGTRRLPHWLALIKEPPMRTNSHLAVGSPTVRVAAIVVATFLLALALAGIGVAGQRLLAADRPIVVAQDGSGDFATIQAAVAAAADGDEILVKAGTYAGPIDIDKDIAVQGEDRDSVIVEFGAGCAPTDPEDFALPEACPDETWLYDGYWFGDSAYGFLLDQTMAELSDLTIRRSPTTEGSEIVIRGGAPAVSRITFTGAEESGSLYVHGGSAAHIDDSDLAEAWVFVEERSPATIEKSTFYAAVVNTDNTNAVGGPSIIRDNTAVGIAFAGEAVVEGNTLVAPVDEPPEDDFWGQGIDVQSGTGWVIGGNTVEGFGDATAITVLGGGTGTIRSNTLTDNNVGIGLLSGRHIVEGNTISGGQMGISILRGGAQLIDNVIEGVSGRGIAILGPASPVLTGNRSCGNGDGLYVAADAAPGIDATNEICADAPTE